MTAPREAVRAAILAALAERPAGAAIDPTAVARSLAGSDEKLWRLEMPAIRAEAVRLAGEGRLTILRNGRPVDPVGFKGLYRLRAAESGAAAAGAGPGNGSGMRPVHQ